MGVASILKSQMVCEICFCISKGLTLKCSVWLKLQTFTLWLSLQQSGCARLRINDAPRTVGLITERGGTLCTDSWPFSLSSCAFCLLSLALAHHEILLRDAFSPCSFWVHVRTTPTCQRELIRNRSFVHGTLWVVPLNALALCFSLYRWITVNIVSLLLIKLLQVTISSTCAAEWMKISALYSHLAMEEKSKRGTWSLAGTDESPKGFTPGFF